MSRVLLVTWRQPYPKREPLDTPAGRRLAAMCELHPAAFQRVYTAVCFSDVNEPTPRAQAYSVSRRASCFDEVVLVGRATARWLGVDAPWFTWVPAPESWFESKGASPSVACSPLPTLSNRWWNDPENRQRAEAFWRDLTGRALVWERGDRRRAKRWTRNGQVLAWA